MNRFSSPQNNDSADYGDIQRLRIRADLLDSEDQRNCNLLKYEALRLREVDLLPEGIDFHCDWNLIPFVADKISFSNDQPRTMRNSLLQGQDEVVHIGTEAGSLEDSLKDLIWLFR